MTLTFFVSFCPFPEHFVGLSFHLPKFCLHITSLFPSFTRWNDVDINETVNNKKDINLFITRIDRKGCNDENIYLFIYFIILFLFYFIFLSFNSPHVTPMILFISFCLPCFLFISPHRLFLASAKLKIEKLKQSIVKKQINVSYRYPCLLSLNRLSPGFVPAARNPFSYRSTTPKQTSTSILTHDPLGYCIMMSMMMIVLTLALFWSSFSKNHTDGRWHLWDGNCGREIGEIMFIDRERG